MKTQENDSIVKKYALSLLAETQIPAQIPAPINRRMKPEARHVLHLTDIQREILIDLINDPTKFEHITNKEWKQWGMDNILKQLNSVQ